MKPKKKLDSSQSTLSNFIQGKKISRPNEKEGKCIGMFNLPNIPRAMIVMTKKY